MVLGSYFFVVKGAEIHENTEQVGKKAISVDKI